MKTVQESHLLAHRNSELLKPWAFKGPTIFNVLTNVIILINNNTNNNDSGLHTTRARNPERERWWWCQSPKGYLYRIPVNLELTTCGVGVELISYIQVVSVVVTYNFNGKFCSKLPSCWLIGILQEFAVPVHTSLWEGEGETKKNTWLFTTPTLQS